uniref:MBL fold metallo-hydrolase n=1 Tax=Phenylobacterium sp. TaxID=1871053 RepID=UPI00286DEBA6
PAKVYEPAPGVFSAVGYGIANAIMVVGKSGVVIIDTTDSLEEARKVWAEFAPRAGGKPVVAIIYTHNHNDHISGASAFPLAKGGKVIAQATLLREAAKWNGVAAPSIAARAARMYGVFLPKGTPDGFVSVGIGPFLSAFGGGGAGGFVAPNLTFDQKLSIKPGGLQGRARRRHGLAGGDAGRADLGQAEAGEGWSGRPGGGAGSIPGLTPAHRSSARRAAYLRPRPRSRRRGSARSGGI